MDLECGFVAFSIVADQFGFKSQIVRRYGTYKRPIIYLDHSRTPNGLRDILIILNKFKFNYKVSQQDFM